MLRFTVRSNKIGLLIIALKWTQASFISGSNNNFSIFRETDCSKTYIFNNRETLTTVGDLHRKWVLAFKANFIPEPEESARHIIGHVLGVTETFKYELLKNDKISDEQEKEVANLCECRLARMPVQYIIKEWDFRDLCLKMCPPVFIPRPETELLVDLVLEKTSPSDVILEVGCGSGAVALSLLKSIPTCRVVAIDQSRKACQLTTNNALLNNLANNLQVIHSKLYNDGTLSKALPLEDNMVDMIVSNPPYVPQAQILTLQPEIKLYEDLRALEAGRDGLRVIKSLLLLAQKVLKPGRPLFMEVDPSHPPLIEEWLLLHPELRIKFIKTIVDYYDRERFVELKKDCC